MTVARTVADVLGDHVVFEVECIDRYVAAVRRFAADQDADFGGVLLFKFGPTFRLP